MIIIYWPEKSRMAPMINFSAMPSRALVASSRIRASAPLMEGVRKHLSKSPPEAQSTGTYGDLGGVL